jgi:phage repressor protein C with HTH and peptisase S24 domain
VIGHFIFVAICYLILAMDIYSTRRINLLSLIRAAGSLTELARRSNVSAPYLSQIKTGFREMGSPTARKIEAALELENGVLDFPQEWAGFVPSRLDMPESEVVDMENFRRKNKLWRQTDEDGKGGTIEWVRVDMLADLGTAATALVATSAVRSIEFSQRFLRSVTHVEDLSSVACFPMPGDAMSPTMNATDLLLVDTTASNVAADGIYVFTFKSSVHVKRLQVVGAALSVRSDNDAYESWKIASDEIGEMTIHGRVIASIPFSGIKRFG